MRVARRITVLVAVVVGTLGAIALPANAGMGYNSTPVTDGTCTGSMGYNC